MSNWTCEQSSRVRVDKERGKRRIRTDLEDIASRIMTERVKDGLGEVTSVEVDVGIDDLPPLRRCTSQLPSFRIDNARKATTKAQGTLLVSEDLLEVLRREVRRGGDDEGTGFDGVGGEERAVPGDREGVVGEFSGEDGPGGAVKLFVLARHRILDDGLGVLPVHRGLVSP